MSVYDLAKAAGFIKQPEIPSTGWVPPDIKAITATVDIPLDEYYRSMTIEQDPNGKSPNAPGAKLDAGKVRPWLCIAGFSRALNEVARVTTKGAEKYTPNGWAEVPDGADRYMEAFGRHLMELGRGEVFDNGPKGLGPDIYHKAQMIWNLLASLELELREKNG